MSSKNLKLLSWIIFVSLSLGFGYSFYLNKQSLQTAEIKPLEFEQLSKNQSKTIVLIDVRTPEEYQLGHIPAAISIPLDEVKNNIPRIKELTKNRRLITYCATGPRSHKALRLLKQHQIEGTNLTGGFDAWWEFKSAQNKSKP